MSRPLRVREGSGSDGFFSQLSVERFGIVPEGLVLPEEVRPFGVSP